MAYFECITGSASSGDGVALIVECDSNFAGSVITADNGEDTFTETCPSVSPYTVRFEGIPTGTYTISGMSQGQTFTTQFTVLDYETTLNATPEGATVLPINDIQIWLNCANIWDKTYTTLDEVLADNTTLLTLISSNNAVDYMVRSTDWSGNGKGLVPTMTSDTTPSGEAIGSNRYSEAYSYWKAFDGDDNSYCNVTSVDSYVGYDFGKNVLITKVKFRTYADGWKNTSFIIKGSNDKTTWTVLSNILTTNTADTDYYFDINPNELSFRYIAMFVVSGLYANQFPVPALQFYTPEQICANQIAMGYIGNNDYAANTLLADATWCKAICNSDYFESVLNVKVPTMTSNTTPSGECFASSVYTGDSGLGGQEWRAFDGGNTYLWHASTTAGYPQYIGYKFPVPRKIHIMTFAPWFFSSNSRVKQYKIQGSKDNSTWVDLTDILTAFNSGTSTPTGSGGYVGTLNTVFFTKNKDDYQYYRLYIIDNYTGYKAAVCNMQFYGRAS